MCIFLIFLCVLCLDFRLSEKKKAYSTILESFPLLSDEIKTRIIERHINDLTPYEAIAVNMLSSVLIVTVSSIALDALVCIATQAKLIYQRPEAFKRLLALFYPIFTSRLIDIAKVNAVAAGVLATLTLFLVEACHRLSDPTTYEDILNPSIAEELSHKYNTLTHRIEVLQENIANLQAALITI
ncbi:MAG: hypothetical protein K9M07_01005 [Simkaniaceae bacterium]|nr:hypothetical protein [Simkaniaceae bacterium]